MTECPIISRTEKSHNSDKVYTKGGGLGLMYAICRKALLGRLCRTFLTKLWITIQVNVWTQGHPENFYSSKLGFLAAKTQLNKSECMSVCLSVCPSVHLSICPSVHLSICLKSI